MARLAAASASYAAVVFAAGFAMGTLRVLALAPALGPVPAVLIELPVMLAFAALAAGRIVRRFSVPARLGVRLGMGAAAFAPLMAAEVALGLWGFGQSLGEIGAAWLRPEGLFGLAGQVGFALMPALVARRPGAG